MKLSKITHKILCIGLSLVAASAQAEFLENIDYQTYLVSNSSGLSLLQAINNATPISEAGRKFHGYTKWNLRWNYRYHSQDNGYCQIATVTVSHSVVITLPKLEAGSPHAARFNRYLDALQAHEIGHMMISQEAGKKIEREILELPAMASCSLLEQRANKLGKDYVEWARQRGREYDERTKHGATQGASLLND